MRFVKEWIWENCYELHFMKVAFNEDSSVAISAGQDGMVFCHDVRSRGPAIQVY
jgi:hypothetical protein